MDLEYSSKKLEQILSDKRLTQKKYGLLAGRISDVLDELTVANVLDDIPTCPPDRRHKMTNAKYTWSIDLSKNYRMWLKSDGIDNPKLVTTVEIKEILDYH